MGEVSVQENPDHIKCTNLVKGNQPHIELTAKYNTRACQGGIRNNSFPTVHGSLLHIKHFVKQLVKFQAKYPEGLIGIGSVW